MPIALSSAIVRCVFSADARERIELARRTRCRARRAAAALVEDVPDSPKLAGLGIGSVSGAPASICGRP